MDFVEDITCKAFDDTHNHKNERQQKHGQSEKVESIG